MASSVFNGTNLLVKIDGTAVGHTTSCEISLSVDMPEATSKDSSGFQEVIAGVISGSISFDGLVDYTDTNDNVDDLATALLGRTSIEAVFGTAVSGDQIYTADGFISELSVSGDMEAAATYSGTITLTGPIVASTNA
jgi:hypothetical protein